MQSLSSSVRRASQPFSASSLLRAYGGLNKLFSNIHSGCVETQNLVGADVAKQNSFPGNSGIRLGFSGKRDGISAPYALNFQNFIHSEGQKNFENGRFSGTMDFTRRLTEQNSPQNFQQNGWRTWRNARPMQFVRDVVLNDQYQFLRNNDEQNCDVVSIFIGRNNTKIHLTDSKGQGKAYISAGCLPEMKSGAKLSRYAAEATSEYMGRKARELGIKSVVVKVNGFTYFKKKRQAVMSFREGFTGSRDGHHPIVYIEDTTRLAHNGCRLKKKRRL